MADANWLAVTGAVFTLSGAFLVTKGLLAGARAPSDETGQARALAQREVDASIGIPVLFAGLLMQVAAPLFTVGANTFIVVLLMALSYGLMLYGLHETWLVDRQLASVPVAAKAPKLALVPPKPAKAPPPALAKPIAVAEPARAKDGTSADVI